nr:MAG TPA: hypothetical protein [Caudoviricetes sp.]
MLGSPKALSPIWRRKSETRIKMSYGAIKALGWVLSDDEWIISRQASNEEASTTN